MKNSLKNILSRSRTPSNNRPSINTQRGILVFFTMLLLSTTVSIQPGRSETVIDAVVAIVGNEIVTQSDIDRLSLTPKTPGQKEDRSVLIHRLIEERLILREVRRKRVSVSEAEIEYALNDIETRNRFPNRAAFKEAVASENQTWRKYVNDLENQLLILKLLSREVNINIKLNATTIQEHYHHNAEQFRLPDRMRLSRLLLKGGTGSSEAKREQIKEKLTTIYSALEKGSAFADLVKKYSEGPRRAKAGDLGFFNQGDLSPEIEQILSGVKAGAVSPPHHSAQSIHIFKVELREAGRLQDFEVVKKEIEERLVSEQRSQLQEQWIASLFEQTYVDIK